MRSARVEAQKLRKRLDAAIAEFTAGKLSAATLSKVERDLTEQIAAAEAAARPPVASPALADLAGAGVDRRWDALGIEQRREVLRTLLDVTVLPSKRLKGSRGFDPSEVSVTWKV